MTSSKPIAKAYLKTDGDESNACHLYENHLVLIFKSKKNQYPIEWIQQLLFQQKIYLIPIVFGGISSALSGLALYNYNLNPWLVLSLLFISLFTLYYGIQGGVALVIRTPIKDYDYFISETTENMKSFIAFFNNYRNGYDISYYLQLNEEEVEKVNAQGFIQNSIDGIPLHVANSIDPNIYSFKLATEGHSFSIKYVQGSDNSLVPKVFDKIPLEAFMKSNG